MPDHARFLEVDEGPEEVDARPLAVEPEGPVQGEPASDAVAAEDPVLGMAVPDRERFPEVDLEVVDFVS